MIIFTFRDVFNGIFGNLKWYDIKSFFTDWNGILGELCNILLFTLIFLTRARKLIEHLTSALTVRASIYIFEMIKHIQTWILIITVFIIKQYCILFKYYDIPVKHHHIEFIKTKHTVAEYTWFHIPRAGHLSLIEIYAHKDKMKDNSV